MNLEIIDDLIATGKDFSFRTNSYHSQYGSAYSRASDSLLSWIATVEDFIMNNYGEESSPFKLYQTFERNKLNGFEQDEFDKQITILIGALKACKSIPFRKKNIS
ncbi:hypothetical protein [Hymenobacter sp. DG25B]|uniref:hypothetical protein n=1 Tax=Hymenobacter sp. DG25B TaxID=1385664 RepID=UPI0012E0A736|nr:hypothetical protein [Hymenobacter sp. DG25B]